MKKQPLLASVTLLAILGSSTPTSSLPGGGDGTARQFPRTAAEAMELDEGDLGKWADGPIGLIILEDEKEVWDDLENDQQRRRFIGWFWDRRDDDLRNGANAAKTGFYSKVAEANKRFTAIPRGWRTDRGRVWVMLGQPDNIDTEFGDENTSWNYFAPGLQAILGFDNVAGDLYVYFARQQPRSYRISGGIGPGVWPAYVLRLMDYVRQTMVTNPELEFRAGGP